MRAIIALGEGLARGSVVRIFGVTDRTIQRWIRDLNRRGVDGLLDKKRPGRPRKIAAEKADQCHHALDAPESVGRRRWTGTRFHGYLLDELGVEVGYSTVIRFPHGGRLRPPESFTSFL